MSDLSRRVGKLEEITGDHERGTLLIRVNAACIHSKDCPKVDTRIEEAHAKGRTVVRLTTNVNLERESAESCHECGLFEKKGGSGNEPGTTS